jgi:glycosyltransferase involved in cell wall biosynthesis
MILGFHYHIPAYEKDGLIYTSGFLGVFLDSLASNIEELVCFMHTPLPSEDFLMDYSLKNKNIRLISMGPHVSMPRRLLASGRIVSSIKPELIRLDFLLIRSPTPLLPALSRVRNVKRAFLIVGDYLKSAKDLRQPFFRKKAIQLWAAINKWQQDKAIKNALVLVNNGLIYNELKPIEKNLHLVKTTTLQSGDFFVREDTCQSDTINMLYTGRLDLSKGLCEMVEVLAIIRLKGIDAKLHLVGWEDKNANEVTSLLRKQAETLHVTQSILFHGKKQVGSELNALYRMADLYIIGSKVNEGFPRTIWEAMANSVPVIASSIGSIPLFLQADTHALLIEPGSIESMAGAVLKIIQQKELRKQIIKNGFELAQSNTLEKQSSHIITLLNEYSRN